MASRVARIYTPEPKLPGKSETKPNRVVSLRLVKVTPKTETKSWVAKRVAVSTHSKTTVESSDSAVKRTGGDTLTSSCVYRTSGVSRKSDTTPKVKGAANVAH